MRDLFGNEITKKTVEINIYADEVQSKECPYTKDKWHYIGIVVEDLSNPLLNDMICERYRNNFDESSSYYTKNNRIVHWSKLDDADAKNICKRWLEYVLAPVKSEKKFYAYILGLNDSKLNKDEFDKENEFNSKYNRFFRSSVLYAIKTFFPNKQIKVQSIFHEEGQQKDYKYFPWHCIYKIQEKEENILFGCSEIVFLPKDHKKDKMSNLIQLCDAFLGVCVSIIHGIKNSKSSKYREELADIFLPLMQRMIKEPNNMNSRYAHANRIMIRFFPKETTASNDIKRLYNQFYTQRNLYYKEQKQCQMSFTF